MSGSTILACVCALMMASSVTSTISPPTITAMSPTGIRFSTPDTGSISLVGLHYSVNSPVTGVAAGQWNFDVTSKTGDEWVHENPAVTLHPGDKVNYWFLVVHDGMGEQLTEQTWTVPEPTTTAKPTTAPPTTTGGTVKPTTPAPIVTTHGWNHLNSGGSNNHPINNNMGGSAGTGTATGTSTATGTGTATGTNTGTFSGTGTSAGTGSCACQPSGTSSKAGPIKLGACTTYPCLIFDDEFDTLDMDVWEHEITLGGGGNWEFQYYTNNRTNSYVRNGTLFIKPTLTTDYLGPGSLTKGALDIWGSQPADVCTGNAFYGCHRDGNGDHIINPIQSARLRSAKSFTFKYGKVEVVAKMPTGDWIWPAIWLLPRRNAYGQWPASGEIDIVEARGNRQYSDDKGQEQGIRNMGSTLHFGSDFWHNKWPKAHGERMATSGTYGDSFHTYVLVWDEDHISISVDGDEVLNVTPQDSMWKLGGLDKDGVENPWRGASTKMAPFDQEFFLIMNVAVGGTAFFPDKFRNNGPGKPWSDKSDFAPRDFWNARGQWYPTWNADQNHGEDAAMQVKSVKVWKLKP